MSQPSRMRFTPLRPDFDRLVAYTGMGDVQSPNSRRRVQAQESIQGDWHSVFRGQGMEFESVRAYVAGDEVRHIDWRVTARTGEPHLKLFQEERQRQLFIVVDDSPAMQFGTKGTFKNVQAAYIAALMGGSALKRRERVGGMVFQIEQPLSAEAVVQAALFRCSARRQPLLQMLRHLSETKPVSQSGPLTLKGKGLAGLMSALAEDRSLSLSGGSELVIISDFSSAPPEATQDLKRAMGKLARVHDVALVAVDDPADRVLPHAGRVWMSGTRGAAVEIDTEHTQLRKGWSMLWDKRRETLQALARMYGIPLVHMNTDDTVERVLMHRMHHANGRAS